MCYVCLKGKNTVTKICACLFIVFCCCSGFCVKSLFCFGTCVISSFAIISLGKRERERERERELVVSFLLCSGCHVTVIVP